MDVPEVSVILPVFRTADCFRELHSRLVTVLETRGVAFELVCVDDACPDGSGDLIRQSAARDERVIALHHAGNLGQKRSVRDGLSASRGAVVVIMDADLQDRPEDIPFLLDALERSGVQAVFAGRRGDYQAASRMAASRVFKLLLHRMLGVPPDAGSFVAMTRRMADAVLQIRASQPYMLALIGATGLPVCAIPIARAVRPSGASAYSEWQRLQFGWRALQAAVEMRRHARKPAWTAN